MVEKIPAMVSMARSDKEMDDIPCVTDTPIYPYGLCISLCQDELEKLDLDPSELNPGDILHLHCLGMVTSTSISQTDNGMNCRVEIQVTNIAAESEDEENEEEEENEKPNRLSKFYK